jgi:uncharacterized membrane protein YdjX (TVP38/TMEM64 family)
MVNTHIQPEVSKRERLQRVVILALILLLVLTITITLFLYFQQNPEKMEGFAKYGYPGAFFISLVSTSTVILPMPGILLLIPIGSTLNPILVGLTGAVGGSIGEMTGYALGRSGRGFTRNNKILIRAEGWMRKRGFITIFIFSLIPLLPIDIVGVLSGVLRFSIWKFLLACFLGKAILNIVMIQAGAWGWEALLRYIE